MDWLTFISTVISAIAWPLVAMIALGAIRGHLPTIGKMVRKVKYKDVEIEFGKAVEAVALETSASFPEIEPASPSQIGTSSGALSIEHLDEIAKLSPRAAIIEAWDRVIFATRKVDGALPRPWNGPYSLKSTVDKFVEHSVLTKRQAELYDEMNKLYFAVVRYEAKNVDEDSVKMYIRSADVMTAHLYAVYKRAERIRKAGGS